MKKVSTETGLRPHMARLEAENEKLRVALAAAGLDLSDARTAIAVAEGATRLARSGAATAADGHAGDMATRCDELAQGTTLNAQLGILNGELRASEGRLDAVVESVTDNAIIAMDFDSRINGWSPGAERLFGWTAAEAIGQQGTIIWTPEDRAAGLPEREMRKADELECAADDRWHMRRDGTRFWGSGHLTPLRKGLSRGYVKILRDRTAERRAEESIRESEARYRALFESMDEAYAVVEMIYDNAGRPCDFRFLEANPAFMTHTTMPYPVGRTATELLGTPSPRWAEVYGRVAETGEPVRFEEPEPALGRVFDLNVFRLGGPGSRQVAVLFTDITARRRDEAALRLAATRDAYRVALSDALRDTADPLETQMVAMRVLVDHLGADRVMYGEADTGTTESFTIYREIRRDLAMPTSLGRHRWDDFGSYVAATMRAGRTLAVEDVRAHPSHSANDLATYDTMGIRAYLAVPLVRDGRIAAYLAVNQTAPHRWSAEDVALIEETAERTWAAVERAQAEQRFQIAHETFRNLVDRSPFGTYIVDADFRLVQISDGGQKAFGILRPLVGHDFTKVVHAVWPNPFASEVIARFRHTLATGEPFEAETEERRADIEATQAYDWKIERIILPDGRPGVVCHFYDLTEKQRQRDQIKMLMGEVNHRSKNMLSLIQAIARQTVETHPKDFLETFGERMRALSVSQDVLVRSEWKAVQLAELIQSQLAHFGDEHGGRIKIDGPLVQINASTSQTLGMALHELATNAAKFGALSNESGRVVISWSLQSDATGHDQFAMSWSERGGPPVAKPARRGFGSTVIDDMLKMGLGCEVEVDFAPTGLVWRIGCPAAGLFESDVAPAPQPNGTAPTLDHAPVSGRRILVVEDEPLIALDFSQTLSKAGFVVIGPASSVTRALALLAQFGCDAAVLDINLGMETSEPVARELIKLGTPFVALSGYSREQQPAIMQTAPLLAKPVSSKLLIAEVGRCLGRE